MNLKLNMSKTREKYPLSRKKIIKKTITSSIGCAIALSFMGCFITVPLTAALVGESTGSSINSWTVLGIGSLISLLVMVFFVVLLYFYQSWYFATYYYEIKEDYIVIKKGPITPNEINIVYQKIQDVYVDQDIFDRMFGLYDVHIASATIASGNLAHIDGLEKAAADGLRDELLNIFKTKVNK